jgi:competence protein ComEA
MPFIDLKEPEGSSARGAAPRTAVAAGIAVALCLVAAIAIFRAVQAADEQTFSIESSPSSAEQEETSGDAEPAVPATVVVYVSGAVAAPGLVELPEGSRVGDAVTAAGGFAESADTAALNLARIVADGEQIDVPTVEEQASDPAAVSGQTGSAPASGSSSPSSSAQTGGLVNINTATQAELETLPGVGPSTAKKIIDDRTANGPFKKKEDLKRVSGIGDKKYASLEASITV